MRHASHWGAFWADVEDGRLVGVRPFERDGAPSPIIHSIVDSVYSPTRIDRPYVRESYLAKGPSAGGAGRGGEAFVPVSWDQALDLVAAELRRVRGEHSARSIYAGSPGWSSAGRVHHAKTLLHRFMNLQGGATTGLHGYSVGAAEVLLPHILGGIESCLGPLTEWRAIAQHTKLIVAFGGLPEKNMQVEAGGVGDHNVQGWMERVGAAGIETVCIGPVRDHAPAALQATWHQPRPGTDTAIMLGLAHTLLTENLHDRAFLARCASGFEKFQRYLEGADDGEPKTADWAAEISGLDADTIRGLARRMASSRTMIMASWSLQRAHRGEQPFWAAVALAAMLGQIGLPGGGIGFGYGSTNRGGNPRNPVASPAMPEGNDPTPDAIPVARISDLLLRPNEEISFNGRTIQLPDIRMIYWCGGNPFHHHQDLNRLLAGWRRPDTVIVHEIWWTAAARHADIVLPATTTLERNDMAAGPYEKYLLAMHRAIRPVGQARDDYAIFTDLAARFGYKDAFTEGRDEMAWLEHLYAIYRQQAAQAEITLPNFKEFWDQGFVELPPPAEPHILYGDFRADPARHPLKTPSGRIEIFSETVAGFGYDDCPGHPTWLEPAEWLGSTKAKRFPLHLISCQPSTRLHGQMDPTGVSRSSKIRGREPMTLNPADAAARGIAHGDVVRIFNDRGACLAGATVSDAVRPGVIVLATGAWYDPVEPGTPGTPDRHGNPNMLTIDIGTSKLAQGSTAQTALVEVERWTGAVPAVTVDGPPPSRAHTTLVSTTAR
ncbi:MAG: molybdopterin guanine dinucleotide-containing S/N-oxide reductase [Alphaproteobacteria bacterium]|nr:molybdopterin guanine dinucleotide-containing S/N-oxide reductase [Alphaproteobacteria bacterium]